MKPRTIAIDGPSASGKSTVGELLASRLGYLYFDTGVMYRAITHAALARGIAPTDKAAVCALAENVQLEVLPATIDDGRQNTILLDGTDITPALRAQAIDASVSAVSSYPRVRDAMVKQQRGVALKSCVVMVGRDIGTVVLPDSDLKIYLTASVEERARRRYLENLARGDHTPFPEVLRLMKRRDELDSGRETAPLRPADDAHVIDTENHSVPEVVDRILSLFGGNGDLGV